MTANAPGGYHLVKWTHRGSDYSTDNPLTVLGVTEDMTLIGAFAADGPIMPTGVAGGWYLYE